MIDLWDESFWLPPNTTWGDIENGPDKAVVYGSARDLWVQVPMVVIILVLRYVVERFVFKPLGESLNVSDKQHRRPPRHHVLETEYRKCSTIKNLSSISKKVDMSERQVERWWRLRRNQDKPSTLVKFTENMWKGTFYLVKESYALFVLWRKEWFWNLNVCMDGYPHQGITNDIWWYYMISSSFYWSLTISQFWDVRRKDFWQMFVHHIATIALLCFSWICNLHRIGSLILFTHEPTDILLEFAKAVKYAQFDRLASVLFVSFALVWTPLRLYVFPVLIVGPRLNAVFYFPMYTLLNLLLIVLMTLNLMWTWFIVKATFRILMLGKRAEDSRSSCSEESDDSNVNNNNNNNFNNKLVINKLHY